MIGDRRPAAVGCEQPEILLWVIWCSEGARAVASTIEWQAKTFSIGIGLGIVIGINNRDSIKQKADSGAITIRPNILLCYRLNHTFKPINTLTQGNLMGNLFRRAFLNADKKMGSPGMAGWGWVRVHP